MTMIPPLVLLFIASMFGNTQAFCPFTKNPIIQHKFVNTRKDYIPLNASTEEDSAGKEKIATTTLFPVIQKIKGIDWIGNCRYVSGADLSPANFILRGGSRYEIDGDSISLTSFLSFPNGKTRQVNMEGKTGSNPNRSSIRLDPTSDDGPIYMVLTELPPDTILIQEVEKSSGRVVMTSSLSLVGKKKKMVDEIVQISHELGDTSSEIPIEGHQVWRLTRASWDSSNAESSSNTQNNFRDATGV